MSADPESRLQQQPPAAGVATAEHEKQSPGVSRRGFLKAGAGAAAVLAAAGPAAALTDGHDHGHAAPEKPKSAEEQARLEKAEKGWNESFSEPSILALARSSAPGTEVTGTLEVRESPILFHEPQGDRLSTVRTYNGQVPGPTIRVRAGETLKVKLFNDLPKNTDQYCVNTDHSNMNMNNPHCFNTTNLHVHGLHVSPKRPSDNVFIEIPPRAEKLSEGKGLDGQDPSTGEYEFCFQLPAFHKPGTHWYHAHKHGSTALQLVNGMAGALIVEDPPDQSLSPKPSADVIVIIQEIVTQGDVYGCGDQPSVRFYVNGRYRPTFHAIAGAVYRWRFINATATPRGFTPLELRGSTVPFMKLIAVDGIYLPKDFPSDMTKVTSWMLAPGNRADFLVRFPLGGRYTLYKGEYAPAGAEQALVEIVVTAMLREMTMEMAEETPPLPDYLRPFTDAELKAAKDAGKVRTVTFDVNTDPKQPGCAGKFQVDNKAFDPDDPGIQVNLGDTEIWTIKNNSGAPHPFHIHVNPFQVINNNGTDVPEKQRYWQDTVIVPGQDKNGAPGHVTFATRFLTFDGPFVLHCHILIHEDWGMMKKVVVNGKGYGPCVPVG